LCFFGGRGEVGKKKKKKKKKNVRVRVAAVWWGLLCRRRCAAGGWPVLS